MDRNFGQRLTMLSVLVLLSCLAARCVRVDAGVKHFGSPVVAAAAASTALRCQ